MVRRVDGWIRDSDSSGTGHRIRQPDHEISGEKTSLGLESQNRTLSQITREGWAPFRLVRRGFDLCGGNPADQVFLLLLAFCADGECVEDAERQCKLDRFILTRAQG